jgi:hypothetical protein
MISFCSDRKESCFQYFLEFVMLQTSILYYKFRIINHRHNSECKLVIRNFV